MKKLTTLKLNNGYYVLRLGRYGKVLMRKATYNAMLFECRKNALYVRDSIFNNGLPSDLVIA